MKSVGSALEIRKKVVTVRMRVMHTNVYQTCSDVTPIIKLYVPAHPTNVFLVLTDLAAMSLSNI